jgi:bile-salt sulfotransferase
MMSDYNWFEGIPFPAISYQREILEDIRNRFVVKEEDLLILTYPKSGKDHQ